MKTPEQRPLWGAPADRRLHYNLDPALLANEQPIVSTREEALVVTWNRLYEFLIAHNGDQELLLEETAKVYPDLFPEVKVTPEIVGTAVEAQANMIVDAQVETRTVTEQCTRPNGTVDYNKLASMTSYAVSVRPLTLAQ